MDEGVDVAGDFADAFNRGHRFQGRFIRSASDTELVGLADNQFRPGGDLLGQVAERVTQPVGGNERGDDKSDAQYDGQRREAHSSFVGRQVF